MDDRELAQRLIDIKKDLDRIKDDLFVLNEVFATTMELKDKSVKPLNKEETTKAKGFKSTINQKYVEKYDKD